MNFGKLDRRIILQRRTVSKDSTGSRVETWSDESRVWAQLVMARGSEAIKSDSERYQTTQQFRIRHRTIDPANYRIFYNLRVFEIKGATEESDAGRRSTLLIDTVAIQSPAPA